MPEYLPGLGLAVFTSGDIARYRPMCGHRPMSPDVGRCRPTTTTLFIYDKIIFKAKIDLINFVFMPKCLKIIALIFLNKLELKIIFLVKK